MHIWKDIDGYDNLYEVNEIGEVRTKEGKTSYTERHGVRKWKQRILKEKNKKGRDVRYSLWKDGKPRSFLAHRLVAIAFLPRIEGKDFINHIDGNPRNNHYSNLEWCDHKENNNHAFDNGLIPATKTDVECIITGEVKTFRSMSKASLFIGKNEKYISAAFKKKGSNEIKVDGYRIRKKTL